MNVDTTNTSINLRTGLSNAKLAEMVPSIFTDRKHKSRTERYIHQPTIVVIDQLRKAGFVPVQAFESRIKPKSKFGTYKERRPYAKHLIRLREKKWLDVEAKVDTLIPDIILTNAHDGSSAFKLEGGLYRLVCSNGLVICSDSFGSIRVPHSGKIAEKVEEGVKVMAKHLPDMLRVTKEWDKIKLTDRQRHKLAKDALDLRFHGAPPIEVAQALEARRHSDEAHTLWRTYNVLQENLLTGGQTGSSPKGRVVHTRRVTSVNNSLHYNRGLWLLADRIAARA